MQTIYRDAGDGKVYYNIEFDGAPAQGILCQWALAGA